MNFTPSPPDLEQISLLLPDANLEITQFTEYSFGSHFLNAADGFSFTIGAETLLPELHAALVPGAAVHLKLNDFIQASGYIDSIEKSASRSSGTEWKIEGRDRLGQAVDACADPTQSLKGSTTLLDGLKTLFKPFGWGDDTSFLEDAEADRQLKSGNASRRRKRTTSDAKGFGRRALKAYKLHQLRPYPKEGVFEFAARIAQRHGLWIWSTADGNQLVVSEPDFESEPSNKIIRSTTKDFNNVLEGAVKFDLQNQPTHIVADGHSQQGEFGTGSIVAIMANNAVSVGGPKFMPFPEELNKLASAGARFIEGPSFPFNTLMVAPRYKVLYLHDDESQTLEQLEAFCRREMALLQRQSLTANYTVEGHGQLNDGYFSPWQVDSTVSVEDEVAGVTETLYVLGRVFNKSRQSGTTTSLELIRLNTMTFSDTGK